MRSRERRLALLACVMLVVGCALVLTALLSGVREAASAVEADVVALERLASGDVEGLEIEQVAALVRATRADLERLQAAARPFLWAGPYLGWLPHYGPDLRAAPLLLESGLDVITAVEQLLKPGSPLRTLAEAPTATGEGAWAEQTISALSQGRPQLLAAQSALREARSTREQIEVAELSPRVRSWVGRLDRSISLLEQGVGGALVLPELLGADGPRTYLVLIQNEDELRPTGGLISAAVRVSVDRGRIVAFELEDSYAVDDFSRPYPEPPEPLQRYTGADLWVFRDSNWSPDFPTAAQTAVALYTISRDVQIDGVIALDQQAIRSLVDVLGPLPVEGFSQPITGENVVRLARAAWEPAQGASGEWWEHRKDFMSALLDAAIRRAQMGLDREDMARMTHALRDALHHRDLLIYAEDDSTAAVLQQLGWDGAMERSDGDYLMVVDANVGFNKVNALIDQRLEYAIDLNDPAHPRASLTVHHVHPLENWQGPCDQRPRYDATYPQMMQRCYWDYLRVYTPSGSSLVAANPRPIPARELLSGQAEPAQVTSAVGEYGRTVFATLLLLHPGEEIATRLDYALPREVLSSRGNRHEYTLLMQKQPGTGEIPLDVSIALPPGATLEQAVPTPTSVSATGLAYELTLETDQELRVVFRSLP